MATAKPALKRQTQTEAERKAYQRETANYTLPAPLQVKERVAANAAKAQVQAEAKVAKAEVKAETKAAKAEAKAAKAKTSTPKKEINREDEAQLDKDIVDIEKSIHETEKQLGLWLTRKGYRARKPS